MTKRNLSICFMLISIILMATPFGIAMTFVPSPTKHITKYFSYFSLMPFGYGNWFPAITGILSIVVVFMFLVGFLKVNIKKIIQVCVAICIISSVLSWLVFNSITIIGACIAVLHIIVFILQMFSNKGELSERRLIK